MTYFAAVDMRLLETTGWIAWISHDMYNVVKGRHGVKLQFVRMGTDGEKHNV